MTGGQAEGVSTELQSLWAQVWHFHPVNGCLHEVPVERAAQVCNHRWGRLFKVEVFLANQQYFTKF